MKIIVVILILFQFLACSKSTNNSQQSKNTVFTFQQVKILEKKIKELYKSREEIKYRFNGDFTKEVVPYITGKNLIIPISPTKLQDSDYLSIGVILDLEKKTEMVILDGLLINYSDFKSVLEKGNDYLIKATNFEAKNVLEIPISNKINVIFPQSEKPRVFKASMIFAEGVREREIRLSEIGDKNSENLVNISLKKEHIQHINEGLSKLYIEGAINQSYEMLDKEIGDLVKEYEELNTILK